MKVVHLNGFNDPSSNIFQILLKLMSYVMNWQIMCPIQMRIPFSQQIEGDYWKVVKHD